MSTLTFIQKSKDIKFDILTRIEDFYNQDRSLHTKGINYRVMKIAQKCLTQFEEQFSKTFSNEICIEEGIPQDLYDLEKNSGEDFFYDNRRIDSFKSFFERLSK